MAQVVAPWGIQGALKVQPATANARRLVCGATVYLGEQPYRIVESRPQSAHLVLSLEGIQTRDQAEVLRGCELQVPAAWLAPLPDGTYYHFQIIGLQVVTAAGESLGAVEEIVETGSNDVYVVRGQGREVLLPALSHVILRVDLEAGRLVVEPPPGLLD